MQQHRLCRAVLVVDAETGQYLRHWGAYGQNPVNDEPTAPDPNFKNPVHCVRIVDKKVYVCDRLNNRIQVFDKSVVGTPCENPEGMEGVCGYLKEKFIAGVTTINAKRTFWDKIVIAHGLRSWLDRRGDLRQDGQRISRHDHELHSHLGTAVGNCAFADLALGSDCIEHARTFFNRPDYDLESAVAGSFSLHLVDNMISRLSHDYEHTQAMIFGEAPEFQDILDSIGQVEDALNGE